MKEYTWAFDLQRFAEGAGEGAGGEATADAGQDVFEGVDAETRKAFEPHYRQAVESKKPDAKEATAEKAPTVQEEKPSRTPLKELLKDEGYKAEFQQIFNARFGEQKSIQEQAEKSRKALEAATPVLDSMFARYPSVTKGDYAALQTAMDNDQTYLEAEAMQRGTTVEIAKRELAIERKEAQANAETQRQQQAQQENARRQQMAQQYQSWMSEGAELQKEFTNFNFETEANTNPLFFQLVQSGAPVRNAYLACHADEIQQAVMKQAAQASEQKAMNQVRSNLSRPMENGIKAPNANAAKLDPNTMTPEQRAKLFTLVEQGKEITPENISRYLNS